MIEVLDCGMGLLCPECWWSMTYHPIQEDAENRRIRLSCANSICGEYGKQYWMNATPVRVEPVT